MKELASAAAKKPQKSNPGKSLVAHISPLRISWDCFPSLELTEVADRQLVLLYLERQNRPYSATDVSNNLKGAVSKSSAQKILNELVKEGNITCKAQGIRTAPPLSHKTLFVNMLMEQASR